MHLVGLEIPEQDYKFSGTPLIQNKPINYDNQDPLRSVRMLQKTI